MFNWGKWVYDSVTEKKWDAEENGGETDVSCSWQISGWWYRCVWTLELRREAKNEYISSQYTQGFQALRTSGIAWRARTGPLFTTGNGLLGSSHTSSIKNNCIQAKYRNRSLVQEGLSSPHHRCHGYWAESASQSSALSQKTLQVNQISGTSQGFITWQVTLLMPTWPLKTCSAEAKEIKSDLACGHSQVTDHCYKSFLIVFFLSRSGA